MAKKKRKIGNFFKKVGGGIKKAVKGVNKVVGGVVKMAGSILPGPLGTAAKAVGNILSPAKVEKIANAVESVGVVQVEKIEETAIREGASAEQAKAVAETLAPALEQTLGAKVDDSKSQANVNTTSKLKAMMSKPIVWLGVAAAVYLLFFNKKKGYRR